MTTADSGGHRGTGGDNAPAGFSFPPHENGLDYVHSVVEHLGGTPTARDLKYAVLHLQAATEVLLKVRLIREHWALVFKDPDKATRASYSSGDFTSIGLNETLARLKNIASIELPRKTTDSFAKLAKERNKLQHFGLEKQAAVAIENTVGEVLDALLLFITEHLKPGADEEEGEEEVYDETLSMIQEEIERINTLVNARLARLAPELEAHAGKIIQCPGCSQFAFLLIADDLHCLFCDRRWEAEQAASEYASEVLGVSWQDIAKGESDEAVIDCPDCEIDTLVWGVVTRKDQGDKVWACFNCCVLSERGSIGSCSRCGVPMRMDAESGFACGSCW